MTHGGARLPLVGDNTVGKHSKGCNCKKSACLKKWVRMLDSLMSATQTLSTVNNSQQSQHTQCILAFQ